MSRNTDSYSVRVQITVRSNSSGKWKQVPSPPPVNPPDGTQTNSQRSSVRVLRKCADDAVGEQIIFLLLATEHCQKEE